MCQNTNQAGFVFTNNQKIYILLRRALNVLACFASSTQFSVDVKMFYMKVLVFPK